MRFTTNIVPILALATATNAAISASTMQSNIDAITQLSLDTNDIAQSISVVNMLSTTPVCHIEIMMMLPRRGLPIYFDTNFDTASYEQLQADH